MDLKDKIYLGICLMFVFGGSLFAFIAWREWNSTGRIIKMGEQAQGMVVEMARRPKKVGEQGTPNSFGPVVLFTTQAGEQVKYYSQFYSALPLYEVGQQVDIWYLPGDPQKATLKGGDAWILPVVFGIFGLAMCLIGYPWLLRILLAFFKNKT